MFEFFRSLRATIRVIFEPRFVGRFSYSYKGPRSWWIHVNPKKYKHVYVFYLGRHARMQIFNQHGLSLGTEPSERELEEELRAEVIGLLNGSGCEWTTVPWSPFDREDEIWLVATSNDDWLMHAKLMSSSIVSADIYDCDSL